jgi:ComF family protein
MEGLLGLLYPEVCQLCRQEPAGPASGYVGEACRARVKPLKAPYCQRCGLPYAGEISSPFTCANCAETPLHFDYARAASIADGPVLDAVHRYKYSDARWLQPFLAGLLCDAALPELRADGWSMVVPVPLHSVKQRERGFNQAEALGSPLARALAIPLRTDLVHRAAPTHTQTTLSRQERAENVSRAFHAGAGPGWFPWSRRAPAPRIRGESVIVIDDVLTTGATANAVARELRRLGASRVCVWSVARATMS